MTRLALALALLAGPALAEDVGRFHDDELLPTCLAGAQTEGARVDCIGVAAQACIDAGWDSGADRDAVLAGCTAAEHAQWQARLAEADAALRAWLVPGSEDWVPLLDAQQAAWPGFVDSVCGFQARARGHGMTGIIAEDACRMRETARQALRLMDWNGMP